MPYQFGIPNGFCHGRRKILFTLTLKSFLTLFIQRSNRRDTLALHAKLDELLRVENGARSELTRLDEQEPEEIERYRDKEVRKKNNRL